MLYTSWEMHESGEWNTAARKSPLPRSVAARTLTIRFRAANNNLGERGLKQRVVARGNAPWKSSAAGSTICEGGCRSAGADSVEHGLDYLTQRLAAAADALDFLGPEIDLAVLDDAGATDNGGNRKGHVTDIVTTVLDARHGQDLLFVQGDRFDHITNGE